MRTILLVLIAVTTLAVVFEITRPYRPDNPIDSYVDAVIQRNETIDEETYEIPAVILEMPVDADIEGYLPVPPGRLEYVNDEMILMIPLLDFSKTVKAGTTYAAIKDGPGLFEASGMPGEAGANVSIAGHRTRDAFYYLDRLSDNDRLFLVYGEKMFTYVFYDRNVVLPTEWSVISEQGFDACTLITCTPIGAGNRRMVVRFILEGVTEYDV